MSARRFRAGCGREAEGPAELTDLAYTDLAFPECPGCRHRLEPDDGPSFCRWRATDRLDPLARLRAMLPEPGSP